MQWSDFCDSLNMYTVFFVTHLGFDADISRDETVLKQNIWQWECLK